MTKLFVGGLMYSKTSQDLKTMFEAFGAVLSAQVIMDKYTNQSKGFGFVEMANDGEAQAAIKALDGSDHEGRRLGVSVAKPREDRPSYSNRGGFNRDYRGGGRNRY
ncbi:RNA-binding protein [Candidatus Daviesbacteria bacterium]|nr:RNA-binding protein [Candidatus Daviesbacteria bacterium]